MPGGLVTRVMHHESSAAAAVLQKSEQKRVRNKCLEWLDSLDHDEDVTDVTTASSTSPRCESLTAQ